MQKIFFLSAFLVFAFLLTGCNKNTTSQIDEKPELAPICPEGYYWIESAKSCIFTTDDF